MNNVFPAILGARNDPWRGAVAFAAAAATHPEGAEGAPTLDVVASQKEEAQRVVAQVRNALAAAPDTDVAILVRARSDLVAILPALRDAGIPFAAVELDALGARQAVQDVVALTHALMQPADRLAALVGAARAVVRARAGGPVRRGRRTCARGCRAVFADARRRSRVSRRTAGSASRASPPCCSRPSPRTGRLRSPIACAAHGSRWAAPRRSRTRSTSAPSRISSPCCVRHAAGSDVDDWQAVRDELAQHFVSSPEEALQRVKIMTLFKAKGLEFDTVIIPGLARITPGDDRQLLRWRTRPQGLLLASPRHAAATNAASTVISHRLRAPRPTTSSAACSTSA